MIKVSQKEIEEMIADFETEYEEIDNAKMLKVLRDHYGLGLETLSTLLDYELGGLRDLLTGRRRRHDRVLAIALVYILSIIKNK